MIDIGQEELSVIQQWDIWDDLDSIYFRFSKVQRLDLDLFLFIYEVYQLQVIFLSFRFLSLCNGYDSIYFIGLLKGLNKITDVKNVINYMKLLKREVVLLIRSYMIYKVIFCVEVNVISI